jgi:DNA polymerase-3 subunit epsilon
LNYAIVDIETSGFSGIENKITEISIFIFDGEKVIDEFTSLVNPEHELGYRIINFTGITNKMVKDAPKFYEIAKEINQITKDCIFVAHSVNFDYNFIRKEFQELGGNFKRKKLCTVRLARKLIPGHKSYSLGKICKTLDIPINGRHRARGDAEATVQLFQKILERDKELTVINEFLNHRNKEATLPPNLDRKEFEALPSETGVYYFKNIDGKIIYVGKAKNIKQRVMSHFTDKASKERKMTMETAHVDYTLTGNELIALLKESHEIKHHYPLYNRSQKRVKESIGLVVYENKKGILNIAWNSIKLITKPLAKFYNEKQARSYIEGLIVEFGLCPKHCSIERTASSACFSYQIKQCNGVCCGEESISDYNDRVLEAIGSLKDDFSNQIIKVPGIKKNQEGFILIENDLYKGFGFTNSKHLNPVNKKALEKDLIQQKDNQDIRRILNYYKRHHSDFVIVDFPTS